MAVQRARYLCRRWSIGRIRTVSTVLMALSCTSVWASAQTERRSFKEERRPVQASMPQGPIEFRCDKLEVRSKPEHRQICRGHVIVRRDDLLLCCTTLTGESSADWALQQIVCTGDVRLKRANQTVWSDAARYDVARGEIWLGGAPLLERDGSQLTGEQIIINLSQEHARVVRPRGQLAGMAAPSLPPSSSTQASVLPRACPIGPRPKGPR